MRAFLAQSVERAAFNRKVVGSRPTGGVFFGEKRKREEVIGKGKSRTRKGNKRGREERKKKQSSKEQEGTSQGVTERFHGVGAAYEILVLRTPVRIWVEPFF